MSESVVHVPRWATLSEEELLSLSHLQSSASEPTHFELKFDNGDLIPLAGNGLKLLGCPIGTDDFCNSIVQRNTEDITSDLALLSKFPHLHQRMKLAIYCCNTRVMYMLRALPTDLIEAAVKDLDHAFDDFSAVTLCFERDYTRSQYQHNYHTALLQIRLGIKQGGFGLTSQSLITPAARFVALREFQKWLSLYEEFWGSSDSIKSLEWLRSKDCESLFPFADSQRELAHTLLSDLNVPDDLLEADQYIITEVLKKEALQHLLSNLHQRPGSEDRLRAIAAQSFPARHKDSDLGPVQQETSTDHLRHRPMGYSSSFVLMSCRMRHL